MLGKWLIQYIHFSYRICVGSWRYVFDKRDKVFAQNHCHVHVFNCVITRETFSWDFELIFGKRGTTYNTQSPTNNNNNCDHSQQHTQTQLIILCVCLHFAIAKCKYIACKPFLQTNRIIASK